VDYGREGSLCVYRSMGRLPSHRLPTEQEWEASGLARTGWPLIGPAESRRDQLPHSAIMPIKSTTRLQGQIRGVSDRGVSAAEGSARRRSGRRAAGVAR
jgi:hypothetical protein